MNLETLLHRPSRPVGRWLQHDLHRHHRRFHAGQLPDQQHAQAPFHRIFANPDPHDRRRSRRAMLRQNGINDVQVISTPGQLTDHYDPVKKTVNLSESVYSVNSVAAAAVAAHECGHAVQHQQAYVWLGLRSKLVPAVQFSSKMLNYIMILGFLGIGLMHNMTMLWVWVGLFAVTTLFSFVTLPVEFDASRRALVWMESSGVAPSIDHEKAKNALFWAAMTYVAAAIGSLAQLLYFLMMALGRRE